MRENRYIIGSVEPESSPVIRAKTPTVRQFARKQQTPLPKTSLHDELDMQFLFIIIKIGSVHDRTQLQPNPSTLNFISPLRKQNIAAFAI
jgi:hypothetical protein